MAVMMRRGVQALAVALGLVLAGCVSTSTLPPAPVSEKEAAQYNMELGISYLRQGDLKTAQARLEKAVSQDSSLATAYRALGLVYERMDDIPAAEKNYRRSLTLAPGDPDTLNAMAAFLCLRKQETGEAMRYFDKALAVPESQSTSNRAMLLTNAGICAKRIDLGRAEGYLRSALAADPGYTAALLQLADVAYERGHLLQARAFLERYLADGRATPDVLWLGYRVEKSLGQAAAAGSYAERLKKEFPMSMEAGELLEAERHGG